MIPTGGDDRSELQVWVDSFGGTERFLRVWETLPEDERRKKSYDWRFLARKKQLAPPGAWRTWSVRAGRGWGKSRVGAEWARGIAESGRVERIALVGPTAADTRDVMVEGPSGVLAIAPPHNRPEYEPSKRRVTWPNGAMATLYSAEEPDRLRGPQHGAAWADELAAWARLQETWDMLQFGLRIGENPQAVVTSTPRGLPFLRELEAEPTTVTTVGSTLENEANLAKPFLTAIRRRYEGTRLGRQEIYAEILDDNPLALWKQKQIDAARVEMVPQLSRVVVAWDPAVTSDRNASDEHGIIGVGAGMCSCQGRPELHGFVLSDVSGIYTPVQSCERVAGEYQRLLANAVIGETNQGGDFIEALLMTSPASRGLTYRGVHAKEGKRLRAEPVASLYEQGRVHHVGTLPKLEGEMVQWNPTDSVESPNRIDALVHGLTALLVHPPPASYTGSPGGMRLRR